MISYRSRLEGRGDTHALVGIACRGENQIQVEFCATAEGEENERTGMKARTQAVRSIVRQRDCFSFSLEFAHRKHRTEDL
jgi:hypothetical protein